MNYFNYTTGAGSELVRVGYEYYADENIVDSVEVKWNGIEVSGLLSESENADIEFECFAHQRKLDKIEAANCELDRGQVTYEERMAA